MKEQKDPETSNIPKDIIRKRLPCEIMCQHYDDPVLCQNPFDCKNW